MGEDELKEASNTADSSETEDLEEAPVIKAKGLSILYDENNTPEFVFTGDWNIRDILTIKRLIGREYRKYQKDVRNKVGYY